ncbi:MAG: hypothetical protein HUJ87_01005 [Fusobacterium varium]|uniref:hypothetical protein n=1 Tax=Fusobacterium varium TaxID=856 RepID=UPI00242CE08D|nr:hypothetical protein [Fusobacterium varium]MCF0169050.1 hypothetical protein [Fusobacterium varium]
MNDKELLYLIGTGYALPEALAKEIDISIFEAQNIFSRLEGEGLVEEYEFSIPVLGNPNAVKNKYILTDEGKEYAGLD